MLSKNRIKFIRSLQLKKFREEHQSFVVEGEKAVSEALQWIPDQIMALYATADFETQHATIERITEAELNQISGLKTPNKALAICRMMQTDDQLPAFALVLDGVQDPGNMGTIIRLADWYGVTHLFCSHDTVDIYNPKVVQATMGSLFRVKVHYTDLAQLLQKTDQPVYGALLEGENVYHQNLSPKGLLVLGNEGNGISEGVKKYLNRPLTIPRFGHAESLNVSMAGAILLSEFFRQQS